MNLPALAMETPESLYYPSESSEDFESAKEVKGTCSSSEIPPGLTAETPGSFYHPSLRAPKIPMAEKRQKSKFPVPDQDEVPTLECSAASENIKANFVISSRDELRLLKHLKSTKTALMTASKSMGSGPSVELNAVHTGLVCYDREFFYGGDGINSCLPGGTILGSPDEVVDLGDTEITQDLFIDFLSAVGQEDFRGEKYNLFEHNCNTFSSEVAMFLTGNKIPQHIRDLPSEVLNSSFGQMIRPMIDSVSVRPSGGTSISPTPSTSRAPESIYEPRNSPPGKTKQREPPDGCQGAISRNPYVYKDVKETVKKACGSFPSIPSCATQVECIKLFCCAISHPSGHSSLLGDSHPTPLPSVTINCLLSKDSELQTVGAALVSNIARLKIHEDIALECSTAVIELLNRNVSPETEHNCLYALRKFMDYNSEVAALVSVMGVNVGKYKGRSSEVDELCRDLEKLLS
ncbi:hypothetical protein pdam_00008780 [Pocillopora damicornis]|uniref:PPPDE domain-containing protein n=1 Tax=Pocillopora damicornis TaxID=46731 RepID=A0A3M6UA98_POCDA|nr:hypothetical protein pdam_00008780 [Pocillopora damicornis]